MTEALLSNILCYLVLSSLLLLLLLLLLLILFIIYYYYYYYYYSVHETLFPLQGPGPNLESEALEGCFVLIDRICTVSSNAFFREFLCLLKFPDVDVSWNFSDELL